MITRLRLLLFTTMVGCNHFTFLKEEDVKYSPSQDRSHQDSLGDTSQSELGNKSNLDEEDKNDD